MSAKDELVKRVNALAHAEYDRLVAAGRSADEAKVEVIHGLVAVGAMIATAARHDEQEWRRFTDQVWRDVEEEVVKGVDA